MTQDPDEPVPPREPGYRVYRSGRKGATEAARSGAAGGRAAGREGQDAGPDPADDPWQTSGGHWARTNADPGASEAAAGRSSGGRGGGAGGGGAGRGGGGRGGGDRGGGDRGGGGGAGGAGASSAQATGRAGRAASPKGGETSYARYWSGPRSLIARLRAESDSEIFQREVAGYHDDAAAGGRRRTARTGPWWRRWTVRRVILAVVSVAVGWVLLSAVLFVISAQVNAGNLPAGYQSQLTSAGPMLTSANTVLILGLDNRPRTGPGSKEGGLSATTSTRPTRTRTRSCSGGSAAASRAGCRSLGTRSSTCRGTARRRSTPPGRREAPRSRSRSIKQFTGLQINHLVVVDLGQLPEVHR